MANNLDQLIHRLNNALDYVLKHNAQSINVKDQAIFTPGPMLHKDSKEVGGMDRYESAKLERENQDAMDFVRNMGREFHSRLKR